MFDVERHRREYHHDLHTVIPEVLPADLCSRLVDRLKGLITDQRIPMVDRERKKRTVDLEFDGRYLHYLADGPRVRRSFPELESVYHLLRIFLVTLTSRDVIVSPHKVSDITINGYPPGGGTLGAHYDTNGITVLIYLTTNTEGPLRLEIEHDDPWRGTSMELSRSAVKKEILPVAGSMVVMQGRRVRHDSAPMREEFKAVAIFNYYWTGDTRRPEGLDDVA